MSERLKILLWIGCAIAVACAPMALLRTAHAQEYGNLITAEGVVCTTAEQIEFYLAIDGDTDVSLQVTNAKYQSPVCTVEQVQFVVGDYIKVVPAKSGAWHITEIGVVSIGTQRGFKFLLKPEVLYTAFMVEKESIASLEWYFYL